MRVETAPRCACAPPLDCSEGLAYYRQKSAVQLADIYLKKHAPSVDGACFLCKKHYICTFCSGGASRRCPRLLSSRKRLVATESRREGVYNRAGERSVTFCEEETLRNE